ncbi:MAG: hypothetical protein IJU83_00635 [Clostridia bacterium]|nr:hypothetical protein [Clostridia bacterium]
MYEEIYKKALFNRLGGITFRIAIFALIVAALTMLSGVLYGLYAFTMVILILITILITLFIILIYFPNIFDLINADKAADILNFLQSKVTPPALAVAVVASILSVIFLTLGKSKSKGKRAFATIVAIIGVIIAVIYFTSDGGAR